MCTLQVMQRLALSGESARWVAAVASAAAAAAAAVAVAVLACTPHCLVTEWRRASLIMWSSDHPMSWFVHCSACDSVSHRATV